MTLIRVYTWSNVYVNNRSISPFFSPVFSFFSTLFLFHGERGIPSRGKVGNKVIEKRVPSIATIW
jgi:hypothetical protein